ncbi:MAG: HlyC/CorC family transporter, partial [Verrucomicrobia bacterium]|nr:HlyC/CorC family transporter [Verrucomicrobiota bacterium]
MSNIALDILVIAALLAANGVFAMAEIAVVSARKARLRTLSDRGDHGARAALELAESPNRFLSTVQIGITLVGVVAGAFGGATLAQELEKPLSRIPIVQGHEATIAFAIVVACITYFSLVIGELIPKRVGLSRPESIAILLARPMTLLSRYVSPLVSVLTMSTDFVLRVLGFRADSASSVSEDEVRGLMQEGVRAGAFNKVETHIVNSALELDQLPVREIMTPRPKVIWLNQDDPHDQIWHKIVVSNHSHFPVFEGVRDRTVGVVSVKSIYANLAAGAG